MRLQSCSAILIMGGAVAALAACQQPKPAAAPGALLAWAYPHGPKTPLPSYPAGELRVPGSTVTYTGEVLNKGDVQPDWFPKSHPPAPQIVDKGRDGVICAECHRIGGDGYMGTVDLAGLKADYIVQQVHEFRAGRRHSWEANREATGEMIKVAQRVSDADLQAAAAYYASLPRTAHVRVIEGDTAPASRPDYYGWTDRVPGQPPQPLKGQVVEVAEDEARMLLADPNSPLLVYAPTGSKARGQALVRSGGPNGQACGSCHGPALQGSTIAPPLAGRSAAYLARQLLDIKTGARGGPAVAQMQGPARDLSDEQIRDIAVYAASLTP